MGKKYLKSLAVFLLFDVCLIFYLTNKNYSQVKYKYIGMEKCAEICHKGEKRGSQLETWQNSKHSKAYADLATDQAKNIAEKLGIKGDPQKSEKCLPCHSTGYGLDKSNFTETFKTEDGVACEACHGPGSVYKRLSIMKDKEKFLANGGIIPDEKVCIKCHNEKNPTYKEFKFDEMVKKIAHPVPKK